MTFLGDAFTPDHWHELYTVLGMQKGIAPSDLLFGDFVTVFATLLKKGDHVKELHARAQGEVNIREALQVSLFREYSDVCRNCARGQWRPSSR